MSEPTITRPPEIHEAGGVLSVVVDGVHVAGALCDRRGWVVTSTLAREVPQLVAKDEADARRFLLFLADLYTGRFTHCAVSA